MAPAETPKAETPKAETPKASVDISSVKNEINRANQDMLATKQTLEKIKSEGSIWTEAGRQEIVRKCLAVAEPKLQENLPKFSAIRDKLKWLGDGPGTAELLETFDKIIKKIEEALVSMVKYGDDSSKEKANTLLAKASACRVKIG